MTNAAIRRPARVRFRSAALGTKPGRTHRRHGKRTDAASDDPSMIEAVATGSPDTVEASVSQAPEQSAPSSRCTKADIVLSLLQTEQGASIASLMGATGWQAHSVRGFLSAVVRKKRSLNLVSEVSADGQRRYRIDASSGVVA